MTDSGWVVELHTSFLAALDGYWAALQAQSAPEEILNGPQLIDVPAALALKKAASVVSDLVEGTVDPINVTVASSLAAGLRILKDVEPWRVYILPHNPARNVSVLALFHKRDLSKKEEQNLLRLVNEERSKWLERP